MRMGWLACVPLVLAACGNDERLDDGGDAPPVCVSDRDFFEQEVWGKVMGASCVGCHTLAGSAQEQFAKFLLQPTNYPGFLEENFSNARMVSTIQISGTSELLLKPTGQTMHGGGTLFEVGSEPYKILEEFVARSAAPSDCEDAPPAALSGVQLLDGPHTLRKAMLMMVGRLPTAAEKAAAADDAGIDAALDTAMREPAFYDWLIELYNDQFLVDRYLSFVGRGVGLLNATDWPGAGQTTYGMLDSVTREKGNLAVTREPLQLIAHIVRNDRPFTEILTADYTVVNPFSAAIYGVPVTFTDPTNENEWQETQLTFSRTIGGVPTQLTLPHAGVLSSPMWLNRFPTTPTNRNRHRASKLFEQFLATDILAVANRPIDAATSTAFNNPTRDDPQCKVCHSMLDPVAGAFQKWNDNDQELWQPDRNWYVEMYAPGFGGEVIPADQFTGALPWLAERVVADPRFATAVTRTVFAGLTGEPILEYPAYGAADFEAHRQAWSAQNGVLAQIASEFIESNFDFRVIVKGVVKSPYFRAVNADGPAMGDTAILLASVGTAHLSTPEELSRKITAVTGAPWARSQGDRRAQLLIDYRIAYGGIDSDLVIDRLSTPNGMMSGVAWRMANEVACLTTAWDFTRPAAERNLFPGVAITDLPEVDGVPSAAGETAIRNGLVHLFEQVLGETHVADDADIDRAYALWVDVWRDGKAFVAENPTTNRNLLSACRGRWDARTGVELPAEQRIEQDPDFTVRSWMAVMTYLLADYRFLHH